MLSPAQPCSQPWSALLSAPLPPAQAALSQHHAEVVKALRVDQPCSRQASEQAGSRWQQLWVDILGRGQSGGQAYVEPPVLR